MKIRKLILALSILGLVYSEVALSTIRVSKPCTDEESWVFDGSISQSLKSKFELENDSDDISLTRLAESKSLQSGKKNSTQNYLFTYLYYRDLYIGGLTSFANIGFSQILADPIPNKLKFVKLAAIGCLNQIHRRYPAFELTTKAKKAIQTFKTSGLNKEQYSNLWEAAIRLVESEPDAKSYLKLLKGSGPIIYYGKGLAAAKSNQHKLTIRYLQAWQKRRANLKDPYLDPADEFTNLLIARAYHSTNRFKDAADYYNKVPKNSNYLVSAISERSWSHLLDRKYNDALGAAVSLQIGGMRSVFHPDSEMVSAIAYFDICQFDSAKKIVKIFKKNYKDTFTWLTKWKKIGLGAKSNLYTQLINHLEKKEPLPEMLAREWLRGPEFLAKQDEMNLIFDQRDAIKRIMTSGGSGRGLATGNNKASVRKFLKGAMTFLKKNEALLVKKLNLTLAQSSQEMLDQLEAVVSNFKLLNAEILSETGDDLSGDAKVRKIVDRDSKTDSSQWNWGSKDLATDDGEVWEDEIGALKTDLKNICIRDRK